MNRRFIPLLILMITVATILGCQSNPTIPASDPANPTLQTGLTESGSGHRCLGYWGLMADTLTGDITVMPIRAALLHVNITGILNSSMGVTAVGVPADSDPAHGLFAFDITLKHPYGTKPQLAGFDVKGILITPGTLAINNLTLADWDETRLENADGYSRWWNPSEFTQSGLFGYTKGKLSGASVSSLTAKINPYKYFADALSSTSDMDPVHNAALDSDNGRGVFKAGKSNTRRYMIRFPMNPGPQVVFGYAVDASWASPTPNPPTKIPDDFPINANQPEAYDIALTQTANTLFYDSETGMSGGVLRLSADVHDWQGQVDGDISGQVNFVRMFAPDLFTGKVDATLVHETATKAQYIADATGTAVPSHAGKAVVAIRAETKDGEKYDQGLGLPSPEGIPISAWQALTVNIVDPECSSDSDNNMGTASTIVPGTPISDTMCDSTNTEDWYKFKVNQGFKATGEIRWNQDAEKARIELLDSQSNLIADESLAGGGELKIDLDQLNLDPETYYIHLKVDQFSVSGPGTILYLLEPDFQVLDIEPANPVEIELDLDCDATWVNKHGDFAYVAGEAGYWVYDITDYFVPKFVSRVHDKCGVIPAFIYPYLYGLEDASANPAGIDFVDFTDPAHPVLHEDAVVVNHQVVTMGMTSHYLFVAWVNGADTKVNVYNYYTDPSAPLLISSFDIPGQIIEFGFVTPESLHPALLVLTADKLRVYNIEDPYNVISMGYISADLDHVNQHMAISGLYILQTWLKSGTQYGASVLNWSPIMGPQFNSAVQYDGDQAWVAVMGTTGYIGAGQGGVIPVDISDPQLAVALPEITSFSDIIYVHGEGNVLLGATKHGGFTSFDLSIPTNPIIVGWNYCINSPIAGAFTDDYAFITQSDDPFGAWTFIDNFDPTNPVIDFSYPIPAPFDLVKSFGDAIAIGSTEGEGVLIMDATTLPALSGTYSGNFSTNVLSVTLTKTRGYISLADNTFRVLDMSLFPEVTELGPVVIPTAPSNLVVNGNYLYGSKAHTLYIFDLSNPDVPVPSGTLDTTYNVVSTAVGSNNLYICTSNDLQIYDITTGDSPALLGSVTLPNAPDIKYMAIDGQYAYVADSTNPTVAVKLWPSDAPTVYGEVTKPYAPYKNNGLLIHDGILYEMHNTIGFRMYDLY